MIDQNWFLIINDYVKSLKELKDEISSSGIIPREICENCITNSEKQIIYDLLPNEKKFIKDIQNLVQKYYIFSLRHDFEDFVEIKTFKKLDKHIKNDYYSNIENIKEKQVYNYSIPITSNIFNIDLKSFLECFNDGYKICDHIIDLMCQGVATTSIVKKLIIEINEYPDYNSLTPYKLKKIKKNKLVLLCNECNNEFSKRACPSTFEFQEYSYENISCIWEKALFILNLINHNIKFHFIDSRKNILITEADKILILFTQYINKQLIDKINPKLIILFATKQDMFQFLQYGKNIICCNLNTENIYSFDKDQPLSDDINSIIDAIVNKLEFYFNEERGNDHDRYIKSFISIGNELGFVTQSEFQNKGSRIDCIWFDRLGNVHSAIEVELSGSIKKDIVSAFEVEPKLIILICKAKTDQQIYNLSEYSILKFLPSPLIIINIQTKQLYYFEKQNIKYNKILKSIDKENNEIIKL